MKGLALPRLLRRLPHSLGFGIAGILLLAMLLLAGLRVRSPGLRPTTHPRVARHAPWVFGRPDARFTLIEYADLECPYCRAYFPVLERWIEEHPQVNWEWWNLPLMMHDPAASREAVLAECAGEADGNKAFWRATAWIYRHTRGDGAGVPADTRMPGIGATMRACLKTGKAQAVIRAQAREASLINVVGTPTLLILDHQTGRTLELQGPVAGDSLLSAIDSLAATGSHHQ